MSPVTHLLASWIAAAKTVKDPRDVRLVTLAGIAPDLDGAGLLVDLIRNGFTGGESFPVYQHYHHYLLHGLAGGTVLAVLLVLFARQRGRVLLLALAVFHLHLLCDFAGSRGPSPDDLWPIFCLGPFDKDPMWLWKGQWRLDGWQNQMVSAGLFVWAMALAVRDGHSVVGVFHRRFDAHFVRVLCGWVERIRRREPPPLP
jgi:hypothetical protein